MTFQEIRNKYNGRYDTMSAEEYRQYVDDCFNAYEAEEFSHVFWTPYDQGNEAIGQKVVARRRLSEADGCDLETLPMWELTLENGKKYPAYPEECVLSEMIANGYKGEC